MPDMYDLAEQAREQEEKKAEEEHLIRDWVWEMEKASTQLPNLIPRGWGRTPRCPRCKERTIKPFLIGCMSGNHLIYRCECGYFLAIHDALPFWFTLLGRKEVLDIFKRELDEHESIMRSRKEDG